eukprot:SAG11_NODE_15749_length_567_cov_1.299145_1_plen_34_part_10
MPRTQEPANKKVPLCSRNKQTIAITMRSMREVVD